MQVAPALAGRCVGRGKGGSAEQALDDLTNAMRKSGVTFKLD
jgi:hypothetical protein